MKKLSFYLVSLMLFASVACSEENTEPTPGTLPTIELKQGTADATSLSFTATIAHASTAAYLVLSEDAAQPSLEEILSEGTLFDLRKEGPYEVTATGLQPETNYMVVAAAMMEGQKAGSNTIYMTTTEMPKMSVSVELVQKDHEKINFRVSASNVEKLYYLVSYASNATPDARYVVTNGTEITTDTKESIEVTGLEAKTEYRLVVVGTNGDQNLMAEPVVFTTEDNPDNIISHTYTRAKGSCLSSGSCFVQFSYEDANEADNFAYDEQWMGLDFRIEAEQEYLPAGEYTVATDGTVGTLLARYSTYGYDDAVELDKGTVKVSILDGEEEQYYKFEIDVFLKTGRHLVASYEGTVDGMPIRNTVYVKTTFTEARATKLDEAGALWQLTLTDADGQQATLDLCNGYNAPYLVATSYTNSLSAEATNSDFEAGEFDGATSTFKVVGGKAEGTHKFATGTLHVDVDWVNQKYMMSLYATLENNAVVEAEYMGTIEGISLAPSTEEVEFVAKSVRASSLDNGAYWTLYLMGPAGDEICLVVECAASPNGLPVGEYTGGVGAGHITLESSNIKLLNEPTHYFTAATLVVNIDYDKKLYSLDLAAEVVDGRTFKCLYEGSVDGMTVTEKPDTELNYTWSSATGKHWYSTNWALTLTDADGKNTLMFDLWGCTSSQIVAGTYTCDDTQAQYIKANYCEFNTEKVVKDAEVIIAYDETTKEYDLQFTATLTDGRQIEGTYKGLVANSPKE